MNASLLRSLLFLFAVSTTLLATSCASASDATIIHIRSVRSASTSTTTTTAAPSVPECSNASLAVLEKPAYSQCVSSLPPADPAFVFTARNANKLCSDEVCSVVLNEFADAVTDDCFVSVGAQKVSIDLMELTMLAINCNITAPADKVSPTSAPTPAPTKTATEDEKTSDGPSLLTMVGIVIGVSLALVIACFGNAKNSCGNALWSSVPAATS